MSKVSLLDTTLRDGEQGEGISFTLQDKLAITELLDHLKIDYIEGGWPGSNPKAIDYFNALVTHPLTHAKKTAFGSTRRANLSVEEDPNLSALLEVNPDCCVIFGKTWDFHVTEALQISLEENLLMIKESVAYLKSKGKEVIYDAEHFFDGYKSNPNYALETLKAAEAGGADIICLCDTNGGSLPSEISQFIKTISPKLKTQIGIHSHDDSGLGVANAIAAIQAGATHVQGTLNGYGERCGNANLSSILCILSLKLKKDCAATDQLSKLTRISHTIDEIANLQPKKEQAYVGRSAFAHKGGIHVSAVLKHPETYEHIKPETVGNSQRVLVSELSGASNLIYKAKQYGINVDSKSIELKSLLKNIKEMENDGYQFEGAEASFLLLMKRHLSGYQNHINLESFEVLNTHQKDQRADISAKLTLILNDKTYTDSANGNGPVAALDAGLRKVISSIFPVISEIKLTDYKVRVLDSKDGTKAKVRVLITSSDSQETWETVGVSANIIKASWLALADSFEYKLMKEVGSK